VSRSGEPEAVMQSFPTGFRAVVFGASGALGGAFVEALGRMPGCAYVVGLSRRSEPAFELEDEASIAACARMLAPRGPFHYACRSRNAIPRPKCCVTTQPSP